MKSVEIKGVINVQEWMNKRYPTIGKKEKVKSLSINSLHKYWPFALYGGNGMDGDYYYQSIVEELGGELD